MTEPRVFVVYVTTSGAEQARDLGQSAVVSRLAACANVFPSVSSIYEWQGQMCEEQEAVLWLKTTETSLEPLLTFLEQKHTYQCPCIVSFPITAGHPEYLDWVRAQTGQKAP